MELLAWPAAAAAAGGVPPVRGLSRCLCLLLFLLGPNKLSPWTAPEAVAARPELVRPAGLLPAVLPLGVLMHPAGLQYVRAATRAAFVLAAVGLGGGLPVAAAAAGWFWLTNALACVMPEKACVSPKKFLVPAWTLALIAALVPPPSSPTHPPTPPHPKRRPRCSRRRCQPAAVDRRAVGRAEQLRPGAVVGRQGAGRLFR